MTCPAHCPNNASRRAAAQLCYSPIGKHLRFKNSCPPQASASPQTLAAFSQESLHQGGFLILP